MLSIVRIKGGLGNQMFQYAFYLALKKKHPLALFLFDNEESLYCHDGITLDGVFGIKTANRGKWFRRFRRYFPMILRKALYVEQEKALQYEEKYYSERGLVTIFDGYWQSEKYFAQIADKVREEFRFRKELFNQKTLSFAKVLSDGNFVSVHIRRGDYLALTHHLGLCDLAYYTKAIDYMKTNIVNSQFVFFSDDIDWVKKKLFDEEATYVTWNQGEDSWQDMYLMSQCKHNIVANSSFSWWGAWLNSNPDKIVVAPKKWFEYSPNYDILPQGWVSF